MSDDGVIDPTFTLVRFNPRRAGRGARAAQVQVLPCPLVNVEPGLPWMNRDEIRANMELFGPHQGLVDALAAYDRMDWFPPKERP